MTGEGAVTCHWHHQKLRLCPTGQWARLLLCTVGARTLTVAALNGKLDEIVRAGSNTVKTDVLRYLMHM